MKALKVLQIILRDPERKSLLRISWEFVRCSLACRCIAVHYFTNFLYRKNVIHYLDYLSRKEARLIQEKTNDYRVGNIVSNKLLFVEHFKRGGFPVPNLMGYSVLEQMYLKHPGEWLLENISTPEAFGEAMSTLMEKWKTDSVFLKPIQGSQGLGVIKVFRDQIGDSSERENLHSIISRNSYVLLQTVVQHPQLSVLNPSSLNTMRIDTFRKQGCNAEIISALLRVGGDGNYVDNVSAGGLFVGVDLQNGKLKENAMNLFHGSVKVGLFDTHPINGIRFKGYQVPLFDKVKQVVEQAADYIPPALIGWDVAVGEHGPVLIEANCLYYGIEGSEMAYGGYKRNPVFRKVLDHIKDKG